MLILSTSAHSHSLRLTDFQMNKVLKSLFVAFLWGRLHRVETTVETLLLGCPGWCLVTCSLLQKAALPRSDRPGGPI
jgi:hypothetical protein